LPYGKNWHAGLGMKGVLKVILARLGHQ